jgi:hypothetical protein
MSSESEDEPLHQGVLIQGASGDVYFIRDDYEAPVRVESREVIEKTNAFSEQMREQFMASPLPEDLFKELDAAFGPLSPAGVIHHKTHRMG